MAGEWLKFECSLPEKPETMAITVAMGWDDTDLTVGKLMRLFRWFDQQTLDGNAVGVTPALLDKLIGVTGFVQAVIDAQWLTVTSTGLALKNFDRHNGASAKSRAQTAKRVANFRSKDEPEQVNKASNAATVTPALAREEKRREEKKIPPKPPAGAFEVPDWIPEKPWAEFVAMRRAKGNKVPFTVAAARGIVEKLEAFRDAGYDVGQMLNESVINGWSSVFEPKGRSATAGSHALAGAI